MAIERVSIPVLLLDDRGPSMWIRPLIEAMADVAGSRATREMLRDFHRSGVRGYMFMPLMRDCLVDPRQLGRAMRKVWRAVLAKAIPGDVIALEPYPAEPGTLVIAAGPIAELRPFMTADEIAALPWN